MGILPRVNKLLVSKWDPKILCSATIMYKVDTTYSESKTGFRGTKHLKNGKYM